MDGVTTQEVYLLGAGEQANKIQSAVVLRRVRSLGEGSRAELVLGLHLVIWAEKTSK